MRHSVCALLQDAHGAVLSGELLSAALHSALGYAPTGEAPGSCKAVLFLRSAGLCLPPLLGMLLACRRTDVSGALSLVLHLRSRALRGTDAGGSVD